MKKKQIRMWQGQILYLVIYVCKEKSDENYRMQFLKVSKELAIKIQGMNFLKNSGKINVEQNQWFNE